MIIDRLSTFAGPTALSTAAPATAKFGSAIDLVRAGLDLGEGMPLFWYTSVAVAATSGGAATLALQLVTADDDPLTTNVEVLLQTGTFALAALAAGAVLTNVALPLRSYRRFIGVRQVIGTAALTAGSLHSMLLEDTQNWRALPDGNN